MDSSLKQENGSGTTSPLMSPSHLQKKARFSVNNIDMYSDSTKTDSDKVDTESEKSCHESHETRDRARTNSQSMNQQTYNTLYLKSLRNYLTRDALPDERHYRNQLSIRRKFLRPTMDELHDEQEKLELFKKVVIFSYTTPPKLLKLCHDRIIFRTSKRLKVRRMKIKPKEKLSNLDGLMGFLWVCLITFLCNITINPTALYQK